MAEPPSSGALLGQGGRWWAGLGFRPICFDDAARRQSSVCADICCHTMMPTTGGQGCDLVTLVLDCSCHVWIMKAVMRLGSDGTVAGTRASASCPIGSGIILTLGRMPRLRFRWIIMPLPSILPIWIKHLSYPRALPLLLVRPAQEEVR